MIENKGYGVIDDSRWKGEVKRFVSEVVTGYVGSSLMIKVRKKPWGRSLFAVLAYRIVMDLMKYQSMPEKYDAKSLIDGLENNQDIFSFFKGEPKFRAAAEVKAGLAIAFFLVSLGGTSDVMAADGQAFSPIDACNALADEDGYQPGKSGYSELNGESYSCATPYKDLSDSLMPNNIALYARGRPSEVTRVKLMLNVNERHNAGRDTKTLARLCEKMGRPQKLSATPDHFGKVLPHVLSRTQRHRARHDPDRPVQWLQPAQACPADEPQPLDGQP
ncbi:hypothetical protein [Geopseudomonas aromaticivorans]